MTRKTSYIGWIPTVSGRLAFSEFGISENPTQSITATCAKENERYVITYQKRYLSDTIIPILSYSREIKDFLDNILFSKTGKLWISCNSIYNKEKDELHGIIGIFDKETWRGCAENIVRAHQYSLKEGERDCTNIMHSYREFIQNESLFSAVYSVCRNGVFRIKFETNKLASHAENGAINDDICLQCYYYIKDNLHTHKHHSERTDSILGLYKEEPQVDWKLDILYSIYRKIITRRRSGSVVDFIDGLGVLSYAESFRCIFKEHFDEEAASVKSSYNRDQMIESLNASLIKANYIETQKGLTRSYILFSLTVFGIVVSMSSMIAISQEKIGKVSPFLINLMSKIAEWPLQSLGFTLFLSFIYTICAYPENYVTKFAFFDFKRIISSVNRRALAPIFFGSSAAAIGLFWKIFL